MGQLAWEETRTLFTNTQESHAGFSVKMWGWDMFFSMMFGGMDRDDNPLVHVAMMLFQLFMRLTVGSVTALIEFSIRLPFWLQEYQLFSSEDVEVAEFVATEEAERAQNEKAETDEGAKYDRMYEEHFGEKDERRAGVGQSYGAYEQGRAFGGGGGWLSTLCACLFWLLAMTGATVATVVIIVVIWSPFIL